MLFSFNILTEEILVQGFFFLIQNVKMPKYEQTFFFKKTKFQEELFNYDPNDLKTEFVTSKFWLQVPPINLEFPYFTIPNTRLKNPLSDFGFL